MSPFLFNKEQHLIWLLAVTDAFNEWENLLSGTEFVKNDQQLDEVQEARGRLISLQKRQGD
jgi:hypothetical protein